MPITNKPRTPNPERSRDASPIWCVTFSKFLRHQLNRIKRLSHTHALPPNPAQPANSELRTPNSELDDSLVQK